MTKSRREAIKAMFGGNCAYCGHKLGSRWHADHIEPVMRRTKWLRDKHGSLIVDDKGRIRQQVVGLWNPENEREDNFFPACVPCNIDKSCMPLEMWRKSLQEKTAVALRSSAPLRHALRFGMLTIHEKPIIFYFEQLQECAA